mgnify:CR=1 FL=1|jgi:hypothetical protein
MDYSYSFQDNIPSSTFNTTSKNVLNWIEENRDSFDWAKDPNAYEMTNLFLFGAKYSHEGKDVDIDSLTKMWNIRSRDFERCNIGENNFVYAICHDSYQSALSGKAMVNDENSHHALRKMAGLGLYLKQQQRDTGKVSFNNPQELLQLLQCSSSLKTFHPELFDKYAFEDNINVLCDLQLKHELPSEISQCIHDAKNQIYNRTTKAELNQDSKSTEIEH